MHFKCFCTTLIYVDMFIVKKLSDSEGLWKWTVSKESVSMAVEKVSSKLICIAIFFKVISFV